MSRETPTREVPMGPQKLTAFIREIPADLETPVSAFLKLKAHGARFLLESVEQGENLGRYSFIGGSFLKLYQVMDDAVHVWDDHGRHEETPLAGADPLEYLKQTFLGYEIERNSLVPRLLGGAVGFISYDYARHLEPIPQKVKPGMGVPLCMFYLVDTLVVFDHISRKIRLVALAGGAGATEDAARARLDQLIVILRTAPLDASIGWRAPESRRAEFAFNYTKEEFCSVVAQAKESIRAGDVYQMVLSQRAACRTEVPPFQVYRALRLLNPSPYMFYLDFGSVQLIGSSPEMLVKLGENRTATMRPIAGTRPRGPTEAEDKFLAQELLSDEKERAEHVMLVDLARNDLGRCCEYGTVKVTELFTVERYSHVMHIVSQVVGRLAQDKDQFDLLRMSFPAGTVTGAPKVRAMQLIEEMENVERGPYAGAVGYFGLNGEMDFCITIRTILMKGGTAYLQAGAGIVADSVPEREYQETLNKMEALKSAVLLAEEGL
ncbi:MAG: anthranilate synthase component I [Planctomycetes bacterium]|nr:anthranilate synthase component I [Planctomycetota bacterium]